MHSPITSSNSFRTVLWRINSFKFFVFNLILANLATLCEKLKRLYFVRQNSSNDMAEMSSAKNFWSLKINHCRIIIFFKPIEIKVVVWNLTIKNGNMFQSNEVHGGFFSKMKKLSSNLMCCVQELILNNDLKLAHKIWSLINLLIIPEGSLNWNMHNYGQCSDDNLVLEIVISIDHKLFEDHIFIKFDRLSFVKSFCVT